MRKREPINKRTLAELLGVSERAVTSWQHEGLPIAVRGNRPGKANAYDIDDVREWLRRTGRGSTLRMDQALKGRVEPNIALEPPAPVVHTPTPEPLSRAFPDRLTIEAIEAAQARSVVRAAAIISRAFDLAAETALLAVIIVNTELQTAFEDVHGSNTGPCDARGDFDLLLDKDGPALLRRMVSERAAALTEDDLSPFYLSLDYGT